MSLFSGAPLFPQYNGPYSFKTIYGPEVAPQEFPECDLIFYDNRKIEVIDDGVTELLHIQMPSVTILPEVPKCYSPDEQYRRDFFEAFKMEKDPPSEQIIYRVFLSTDGAKITRMFLEKDLRCARNEVVLFVEVKNEEDVFSGSALYMKMGEYAAEYLKANGRVSELAQNIAQHGVEKEKIMDLIASLSREETFTDTLLNILAAVVKGAAFIINLPLKAASKILGWGIEHIETLLIDESFWNPDHPKYNRSVEIAIKQSAEGLRKLVSTTEAKLARVEQKLGRYDLAELKNTVSAINHVRAQLNSLPTIVDVAEKIITEGVHFFLGLLCGLWNAIIELVTGLLGFIKLLIDILTAVIDAAADFAEGIGVYFNLVLEYLDNFWQAIRKIDLFDVAKTVFDQAVSFIAELPNAVADWVGGISVNIAELGYFIGYVGANIAEFFIPVLKVAKLAKAGKFAAAFDEIAISLSRGKEVIANLATKVIRTAINSVFDAIDFSINLLRGGTKALKDFIEEVFSKLRKWLDEIAGKKGDTEYIPDNESFRKIGDKLHNGERILSRKDVEYFRNFLSKELGVGLKIIGKEPLPVGRKKYFKGRTDLSGVFSQHEGIIYLWHPPKRLTLYHEAMHMKFWLKLKRNNAAYNGFSTLEHETYVWEQIVKSMKQMKWNEAEINNSLNYLNKVRANFGKEPVTLASEIERLK